MRLYYEAKVENMNEVMVHDIIFGNDETNDIDDRNENCIHLEGLEIDSSYEGNNISGRWKGVEINDIECNSIEDLKKSIEGMHIINTIITADYNKEISHLEFTELMVEQGDEKYEINLDDAESIEFVNDVEDMKFIAELVK